MCKSIADPLLALITSICNVRPVHSGSKHSETLHRRRPVVFKKGITYRHAHNHKRSNVHIFVTRTFIKVWMLENQIVKQRDNHLDSNWSCVESSLQAEEKSRHLKYTAIVFWTDSAVEYHQLRSKPEATKRGGLHMYSTVAQNRTKKGPKNMRPTRAIFQQKITAW